MQGKGYEYNMNYIITGGAGFIGSHVAEELSKAGSKVVVIDDLSSGFTDNLSGIKNVDIINKRVQDIEDDQFSDILKNSKGIFHLAAQASVPLSVDEFYESSKNNLLSTIKTFDWARKFKLPVIYASSSAVYGNLPYGSETEESIELLTPYAADKLVSEHYAKMAFDLYGLSSIGFRFFNVYGPRQDPNSPYSGVISIFADHVMKKKPVQVNGGYQTRDFVYVKDVVRILLQGMKHSQDNQIFDVMNVGTNISVTIDNLLLDIFNIFGYKTDVKIVPLPKGDPEKSGGNSEKVKSVLGCDPAEFTPLKPGLEKTIEYIRDNS